MFSLDSLRACRVGGGRHENVDHVLAMLIHERRNRSAIDIVETTADERESVLREIGHRGREIQLAIEPRFDRVLIGRADVHQMRHNQRSHMTGDHFARKKLVSGWSNRVRGDSKREHRADCHRYREWIARGTHVPGCDGNASARDEGAAGMARRIFSFNLGGASNLNA
jgi:hypothetical protein